MTDTETVVVHGGALGISLMMGSLPVSTALAGKVTVDGTGKVEFTCDGEDCGDSAVRTRLNPKSLDCLKPCKQVVGLTQVGQDKEPRFAVHTPGLDDPPVGIGTNPVLLEAGHAFVYTRGGPTMQEQHHGL
jgi:hypothetical protein